MFMLLRRVITPRRFLIINRCMNLFIGFASSSPGFTARLLHSHPAIDLVS